MIRNLLGTRDLLEVVYYSESRKSKHGLLDTITDEPADRFDIPMDISIEMIMH